MTNRPMRSDRHPIDLPCQLGTTTGVLAARTIDIGFGGIGVRLPADLPPFDSVNLRTVAIERIGVFDVACRWRRGDGIGLQFIDEDEAEPMVQAYLDGLGVRLD